MSDDLVTVQLSAGETFTITHTRNRDGEQTPLKFTCMTGTCKIEIPSQFVENSKALMEEANDAKKN